MEDDKTGQADPRSQPDLASSRWIAIELKEWRNAQWADTIESLNPKDQSLWKMTNRVMWIPYHNPPLQFPGGLANSDSEKSEALADKLESQFQPVPIIPMQMDHVERDREAMDSFALTLASEPLQRPSLSSR